MHIFLRSLQLRFRIFDKPLIGVLKNLTVPTAVPPPTEWKTNIKQNV